jgi:hypothetical protein
LLAFGGDGFEVAWHRADPSRLLGSFQFNRFRRSTNFGLAWSDATSGMTDVDSEGGGQFMTVLASSPDQADVVFTVGKSGVWKSTNFGGSWSLRSISASQWGFSGSGKVRVSLADGNVVWAGYEMGVALTSPEDVLGKLHVSTDRGETFSPVATPADLASGRISGLATHPTEPNTAYVLFSASSRPKVLRTRDLGQSWEDLSGYATAAKSANGFPDVAVFDLLVLPENPSEIWVGTEIGLFISRDAGGTWSIADNGLPAVSIWQLRIVGDEVVVATHGRGIWSVDVAEAVAASAGPDLPLPGSHALAQNYPNPFNSSTTVDFSLSARERVRIAVYDALGRLVAVLQDEALPAGRHSFVWNAADRASGVYVLRMSAGSFHETRLMTIVR